MRHKSTFLADFHVHTNYSDGRLSVPEVVDLYGMRGFGAIAITDHIGESHTYIGRASAYLGQTLTSQNFGAYLEELEEEANRAWEQYGMVLIKGFELSKNSLSNHRSAHILGLGISAFLEADADPAELVDSIHAQGGIAIAAHPVHTRRMEKQTYHLWNRRKELADKFDAWEVASGPHLFEEVQNSKLPKIASSDLHKPNQMRSWKTVLDCERHSGSILDAIRKQQIGFAFYPDNQVA